MRKEEELLVALRKVIRAVDLRSKQLSKDVGLTAPTAVANLSFHCMF